jgi:hypothetical protein
MPGTSGQRLGSVDYTNAEKVTQQDTTDQCAVTADSGSVDNRESVSVIQKNTCMVNSNSTDYEIIHILIVF